MYWGPLKGRTLQSKLLLMTLAACAAVLVSAFVALLAFEVPRTRAEFEKERETLARVTAENLIAAVTFEDRSSAEDVWPRSRSSSMFTRPS